MSDLVKVWDGGDVDEVDDGKVLDLFRDRVEGLVHGHALGVPVVAEADDDDAVLFGLDGLVDVPARGQMGKKVRHGGCTVRAGCGNETAQPRDGIFRMRLIPAGSALCKSTRQLYTDKFY